MINVETEEEEEEHDIKISTLDLESDEDDRNPKLKDEINCDSETDKAYQEFIKVTRAHQAERERLKRLKKDKNPEEVLEEYYKDVSQVNTLVEDNLAQIPNQGDEDDLARQKQAHLIKLYGSHEAYERIRSMEMYIDRQFKEACLEQNPNYWPAIPINARPYLNAKR